MHEERCQECEHHLAVYGNLVTPREVNWNAAVRNLALVYESVAAEKNFRGNTGFGRGLKQAHRDIEGFGNTTYGELTENSVYLIIQELDISPSDTFLDLGSGIGNFSSFRIILTFYTMYFILTLFSLLSPKLGNVVLLVALHIGCKSMGIEIDPQRLEVAIECKKSFQKAIEEKRLVIPKPDSGLREASAHERERKKMPEKFASHLEQTEFLKEDLNDRTRYSNYVPQATKVLCNNVCFDEYLCQTIYRHLAKHLTNGSLMLSLKPICPRHREDSRCERSNGLCSQFILENSVDLEVDWKADKCSGWVYRFTSEK